MCGIPGLTFAKDETEPIETTFELNETLYAKANIPPTEEVHIWLGVRFDSAKASAVH